LGGVNGFGCRAGFLKGVTGTRFGSLELKIGSLESDKSGP